MAVATPIVGGWGGAPAWLVPWIPPARQRVLNLPLDRVRPRRRGRGELLAREDRPRATLAIACALVATGFATDRLPPFFARPGLLAASPAWFAIRLGATVALAGALQLLPLGPEGIPVLRTLGRRSLLAYVASVELTYGLGVAAAAARRSRPAACSRGVAALVALTWLLAPRRGVAAPRAARGAAARVPVGLLAPRLRVHRDPAYGTPRRRLDPA